MACSRYSDVRNFEFHYLAAADYGVHAHGIYAAPCQDRREKGDFVTISLNWDLINIE